MNSVSINEEMKKNPELKKEDIKALEEWSSGQLHLPKISESDFALFLHCNSYDVEATKEHIENFYTMRTHLPEFFADRDPEKNATLRKTFDRVSIISLEKRTKEGYKIILTRLIDTDANNYVFNDAIKFLNMVLDICVHEEGTSEGYVIVVDLNGANISHTTRLTWLGLKKFMLYIHKAAPIKWKGLHYINTGKSSNELEDFVVEKIVNSIFVARISLHSSMEKAGDVLSLDIKSIGPVLALHKAEIKKLESYRNWFLKSETQFKVNETLRVGGPMDADKLFGADKPNFRNLDID
ncbi:hypothetical protein TSAR_005528 [Trichomalopsis sarcophagae]|uniref:CRAL-TRIO domain-containing protein n=1 Tax=Trichomalopsis sarcophagae TaxID=543379 RepID=A0A232EEL9_9HYME|nr:hypothetical protein TSAR_005528 [Trichomalopsis sarcophagae]